MAELIPAPFADLVTRLFVEPQRQDTLFELPRRKWYQPQPGGPDLSVRFHGQVAGNPSGPAAGPHTQMAQNILLSYVAGGRMPQVRITTSGLHDDPLERSSEAAGEPHPCPAHTSVCPADGRLIRRPPITASPVPAAGNRRAS
jgi:hypothetical protein